MGISVVSTVSASAGATAAAAAAPSTAATGGEGIPGDFAALLFGELKNLLPKASTETTAELEDPQSAASTVDPAAIAALIGNAQQAPEIAIRGTGTIDSPLEKGARGLLGTQPATADKDGQQLLDVRERGTAGLTETSKAALAATQSFNRLLPNEAANIAADAAPLDASPTAPANPMGGLANGRPLQDAAATSPPPGIAAHLNENAWPKQFGDKVVWMAKNDQQSAQISINPPQLGPIQITLNLSGDQATLAFASPHAEVRQAIESALPQLKEMLSSAGINLGQSNVGANLSQQNQEHAFSGANGNRSANENAILPANEKAASIAGSAVIHRGRGMVDLFA
ncbi:MAG TPA: flagellar hook-length control protein FliK [Azonexus sp.]|nr:flagellar hook-length control protein FliK [Azonexus sp.]